MTISSSPRCASCCRPTLAHHCRSTVGSASAIRPACRGEHIALKFALYGDASVNVFRLRQTHYTPRGDGIVLTTLARVETIICAPCLLGHAEGEFIVDPRGLTVGRRRDRADHRRHGCSGCRISPGCPRSVIRAGLGSIPGGGTSPSVAAAARNEVARHATPAAVWPLPVKSA